jgi:hypothetical protein
MNHEQVDAFPGGDWPADEEKGWRFAAVGLNGRTWVVRVDRLRGSVRLLLREDPAPQEGAEALPPLPQSFVWNSASRSFERISTVPDG